MTTIAATLGQLVTRVSYEDLPERACEHAAMLIASTIASAAAGFDIESAAIVRALAREQGGVAEATVWFDAGASIPAVNACRVNALASDAAACDDSDLRTIVHLGTPLTATTLALAERTGATGKDVLAAMVVGYEVAGRIGEAVMPAYRDRGFHGCIVAIFAAAVASGRILELNARQMAQAIAIAAVSMGGLATAADTSIAREYFAGNAAMLGMNAALAAKKGYVVEESILEVKNGFFEVYGGEDIERVHTDWGRAWGIVTDMAIKLVPGGHPYHAIAEAAAIAASEGNIDPDNVDTITMTKPLNAKLRIGPLKAPAHPKNLVEVAHTPAYFAAAAVADKNFSWVHATDAKINDPVIHRLIDRVRVGAASAQDAHRFRHGATVDIKTRDGRSVSSTVYAPRGSGARGIAWADVDAKFRTLVAQRAIGAQSMDAALRLIHSFGGVQRVSELTLLLR